MKKGEKYIIEIAETYTHFNDDGIAYHVARIKGFSTLTFDQNGLDRLEKVEDSKPVEEKKPYNCKFVVTESNNAIGLTIGKIYKLENGIFKNDYYTEYPSSKKANLFFCGFNRLF